MRRFLQASELSASRGSHQCPQLEEQQPRNNQTLELEDDSSEVQEVAAVVESTIMEENPPEKDDFGPWPYIKKYYKFKSKKGSTLFFQCQQCLPATKVLSCTLKSRNGLKSHHQRNHPLRFKEMKACFEEGSKRAKKRSFEEDADDNSRPTSSKKTRLHQTVVGSFTAKPIQYRQSFIDERVSVKLSRTFIEEFKYAL